jgi:hypothetical protein
LGIAARAGGDFGVVTFGGSTTEVEASEQSLLRGLPHSWSFPANTVALCVTNGATAGITPVKLFLDRSMLAFTGRRDAISIGKAPAIRLEDG